MTTLHLPMTLLRLFPGLERKVEVEATSVVGAIDELDARWPGLRDRLCEPGPVIRPHIHVYINGERAQLDAPLDPKARVDVIAAISGG
jgi:molybdopterin synthase sulfur carrier subunit